MININTQKNTWAGKEIYFFDSIDSTNVKAFEYAKNNCSHGTLVLSDGQTAGKGRRGRSWSSEKGTGLYMSLVLRPKLKPQEAPGLTLVAALAVARAIESLLREEDSAAERTNPKIKWPNDVVINRKKVCGILTEMHLNGMEIDSVVVGIGINVHQTEFPEDIKATATSLDLETGSNYSRSRLTERILQEFEVCYEFYEKTGDLSLLKQQYENYLANIGNQVKVLDPAGEYEGTAKGITNKGELIVDTMQGIQYVSGGEVSVRGIYGYV